MGSEPAAMRSQSATARMRTRGPTAARALREMPEPMRKRAPWKSRAVSLRISIACSRTAGKSVDEALAAMKRMISQGIGSFFVAAVWVGSFVRIHQPAMRAMGTIQMTRESLTMVAVSSARPDLEAGVAR